MLTPTSLTPRPTATRLAAQPTPPRDEEIVLAELVEPQDTAGIRWLEPQTEEGITFTSEVQDRTQEGITFTSEVKTRAPKVLLLGFDQEHSGVHFIS